MMVMMTVVTAVVIFVVLVRFAPAVLDSRAATRNNALCMFTSGSTSGRRRVANHCCLDDITHNPSTKFRAALSIHAYPKW